MSEILANIVVEQTELSFQPEVNNINVTPEAINLNIFTGGSGGAGQSSNGELLFNNVNNVDGVPFTNYDGNKLTLGNASNLKITGGTNTYFLQTDGTGNLTWAVGAGNVSGNGTPGGANTQIQFNDGGANFGGSAGFTFDKITNEVSMPGNLTVAGNIIGNVTITGNVNSQNANLGNLVTANYFSGNGSLLTGINGANVSNVANANYANFAGDIINSAQPNITSVGNLTNLVVSGNLQSANANLGNLVTANYFSGDGSLLSNINGSNVSNVANANYAKLAGNIINSAQPNITSVGNLTSLTISGNLSVTGTSNLNGNISTTGTSTVQQIKEKITANGTGANSIINFDILTSAIVLQTANAVGNFTLNFRGNSTVTFNNVANTNESVTCSYINKNGITAYVPTSITIDGSSTTVVWSGNTGNAGSGTPNGYDLYTFNLLKTSANTYIVLSSRTGYI